MSRAASSSFTVDQSRSYWNAPAQEWLVRHGKEKEWDGLATASVVSNSEGKVLVIQRASPDSMPNKWELPGGAVDDDDPTILHAAARELAE
jgi:8-oxo-dGTP pyrophosphatase MutT (NUDIX family)